MGLERSGGGGGRGSETVIRVMRMRFACDYN